MLHEKQKTQFKSFDKSVELSKFIYSNPAFEQAKVLDELRKLLKI
jgi:hypothetical protein